MSFRHQSLAWDLDLPSPACKLVLMGLASYADEQGYCFPGQETLAIKTCQTARSVRTHLEWLEDRGYIQRQHRQRLTGRTSDEYLLCLDERREATQPENFSGCPTGKSRQTQPEKFSAGSIYESTRNNTPEKENPALAIYQTYPLKVGKAAALKAISKALRTVDASVLTEAVREYARAVSGWKDEDRRYIPQPATWFNQGRWEDDRRLWHKGNTQPASPERAAQERRMQEAIQQGRFV